MVTKGKRPRLNTTEKPRATTLNLQTEQSPSPLLVREKQTDLGVMKAALTRLAYLPHVKVTFGVYMCENARKKESN